MSAPPLQEEDIALSDKKSAPPTTPVSSKKLPPLARRYKRPLLIMAGIISLIAAAIYTYDAYTHEETDDAYVTGHLHDVSSRINAVVTDVLADDNQPVKEGDVLVKLDSSEYLALVAAAQAQLAKAQADLARQTPLVALHAVSPEDLDATRSTRDVDLAQLRLAELQVDYSTIKAPASGYVGRKDVETGNRVSPGQTLLVIVEPELWIVANFKETQLARMHPGQPAQITIDSIPGKVFPGKVDSFSPATGNEFALLPADNATGNFTKIVQRVPVKITFDPGATTGYENRIRAGESAVVKVAVTEPGTKP
ncbi:MAG TPA: HlyD family secretion protein [Candidatus Methylacidiphilales bacterium]|nr:HlyD family secretion protein [Candidatus Methylacidiphilales bacterium]